jgi:hypothetical protein
MGVGGAPKDRELKDTLIGANCERQALRNWTELFPALARNDYADNEELGESRAE